MRFGLRVHRNSHGANFDGAEKGVEEFGRVQKQQEHAFFSANAKSMEGVAHTIGAPAKKLLIRDALVADTQ